MTDHWNQSIRRNAVKRDDYPFIGGLAVAAGLGAAMAGCHPTGQTDVDAVLCFALAAGTVWVGASASWWSLVLVGWLAALGAGTTIGVVAALVASAIGLYLGTHRRSAVWLRCASVAIAVQVLLRMQSNPFFAASALVAAIAFIILWGVSAQRRRHVVRYRIRRGVLIGLGVLVGATLLFAARVAMSRDDLTKGYEGVLDGLSELQSGDAKAAAATLHAAADDLRGASDAADSLLTQPARLVPVVAQHRAALATVIAEASSAAEAAANALDVIDLDALAIEGGVIDVPYIAVLAGPLAELQTAVDGLRDALDEAESPWLIGPAADRLDRYRRKADQASEQAAATSAAAATGPAMLGADGARHYLLVFASPGEARAAIGVAGNYAVMTIDHGAISRSAFGRITELGNEVRDQGGVALEVSDEFRSRYGPYSFNDDGTANAFMWSNVAMTPDVPTAASIMAQLWKGTGHDPVDGVFIIDPAGLAALLKSTGPITVAGLDTPLDSTNLERFLLLDQYQSDTPERSDLLEKVATATLDAVLKGALPSPQVLAHDLGPAATGGHLLGWATRPEEQELMRLIGMSGGLPSSAGQDGLAIVTNNATANKIDAFLERNVRYEATVHGSTIDATVTVTLHNGAPATGYPTYVIGSEFLDLPSGTNRTLLSVYSPWATDGATLDGEEVGVAQNGELGYRVYTARIDLAPGQTRTFTIHLTGYRLDGPYSLVIRPQPMAVPDDYSIDVRGDVRINYVGRVARRSLFTADDVRAVR